MKLKSKTINKSNKNIRLKSPESSNITGHLFEQERLPMINPKSASPINMIEHSINKRPTIEGITRKFELSPHSKYRFKSKRLFTNRNKQMKRRNHSRRQSEICTTNTPLSNEYKPMELKSRKNLKDLPNTPIEFKNEDIIDKSYQEKLLSVNSFIKETKHKKNYGSIFLIEDPKSLKIK